jgi:hypothetical protein
LWHISDASLLWWKVSHIAPVQDDSPRSGTVESRNALNQNGLACPRRTEQDEIFALTHLKGDIPQIKLAQSDAQVFNSQHN